MLFRSPYRLNVWLPAWEAPRDKKANYESANKLMEMLMAGNGVVGKWANPLLTRASTGHGVNLSWTPDKAMLEAIKTKAEQSPSKKATLNFFGNSTPFEIKIHDFSRPKAQGGPLGKGKIMYTVDDSVTYKIHRFHYVILKPTLVSDLENADGTMQMEVDAIKPLNPEQIQPIIVDCNSDEAKEIGRAHV